MKSEIIGGTMKTRISLVILVALLFSINVSADGLGAVKGTVTDADTGDPVKGVKVEVVGTQKSATTDADGKYLMSNIKPGKYDVKASHWDYQEEVNKNVNIKADKVVTCDFVLKSELMYELEETVAEEKVKMVAPKMMGKAAPMADGYFPPSSGGTEVPNAQAYDLTFYENYGVNPFVDTEDDKYSTFGLDVDTASYTKMRNYVTDGNFPDKDFIRTEEFLNYFNYRYST